MGRSKQKPLASIGRFTAVPHRVINSANYKSLSHTAARLLWDIAAQCHIDDNGRLLAGWAKMSARGWKSADTLHRARIELVSAGFLFQTVQGHRPNKASWYALTWFPLAKLNGYDAGTEYNFRRWAFENSNLDPIAGQGNHLVAPTIGQRNSVASSANGPIRSKNSDEPNTAIGHPLEMPSITDSHQHKNY